MSWFTSHPYRAQQKRNQEYHDIMQLIGTKVNPYELFQLEQQTFTLPQLRQSYKKLALRTHPDRPGGTERRFQLVTQCYFYLYEAWKQRNETQNIQESRDLSQHYASQLKHHSDASQKAANDAMFYRNSQQFDIQLFNKIYEQHQLPDFSKEGHGTWLKQETTAHETTKSVDAMFGAQFNRDVFNTVFDKERQHAVLPENQTAIVIPQDMMASTTCASQDLSYQAIDNYSIHLQDGTSGSDVKHAFTLAAPVPMKTPIDYKQKQAEHDVIPTDLNHQEWEQINQRKNQQEVEEVKRRQTLQEYDYLVAQQHSTIQNYLLQHHSR